PRMPGPMLRTKLGARVRLKLRNALTDALVLCDPFASGCVAKDTVPILPGNARAVEFMADRAGTFLYRAVRLRDGKTLSATVGRTELVGALVVDSANAASPGDRVLVITDWAKDTTADPPFFQTINGKMWPNSERFDLAVGDSVHWRLLNATQVEH